MKIVICDDSKTACDRLEAMTKNILPDVEIKCFPLIADRGFEIDVSYGSSFGKRRREKELHVRYSVRALVVERENYLVGREWSGERSESVGADIWVGSGGDDGVNAGGTVAGDLHLVHAGSCVERE